MVELGEVCQYDRSISSDTSMYIGMEDVESNTGRISSSVFTGENYNDEDLSFCSECGCIMLSDEINLCENCIAHKLED